MSIGPKPIYPQSCPTLELKDLSDVIDFDLASEEGELFGFEYTDTGKYRRRAIDEKKLFKLGQLRDVVVPASPVDKQKYTLTRDGTKWVVTPIPDPILWDISFKMISPYVLSEDGRTLRKVMNSGPLLVSLVPHHSSRNNIKLIEQEDRKYLLTVIDHSKQGYLEFVPVYNIREEATIIYEFTIKPVEGLRDEQELSRGIKIKWDRAKLTANNITDKDRVFVMFAKKGDQTAVHSSLPEALTVELQPAAKVALSNIDLKQIDLISFHFANKLYDPSILETEFIQ